MQRSRTPILTLLAFAVLTACTSEADPRESPAKKPAATAKKVSGEVDYEVDGVTCKGYLAVPDGDATKAPGVLIVHEWWGHNEYVRKRADMLAKLGYVAFALDMYGEGKTADHPKDAGAFAQETLANLPAAEQRFDAAKKLLRESSDPTRTAAIGYCFGGGVALHMARRGADLKGVASFHGALTPQKGSRATKGAVKAAILVCTGAADPMIPSTQVEEFKKEMQDAGADLTVQVYPNAKHSFTNPGADEFATKFDLAAIGYDRDADEKSWAELQTFLKRVF